MTGTFVSKMLAMQANKILLEILFCLFLQFSASLSVEFCPATWVEGGYQDTCFFVSYAKGEAQACPDLPVLCQWQGCTAATFAILCLTRDWLYQNCPALLCRQRARRNWENPGENSNLPGWKKKIGKMCEGYKAATAKRVCRKLGRVTEWSTQYS